MLRNNVPIEEFHPKRRICGRLTTLMKRLGVLALFVGIGLAGEVEAGCRQVCTEAIDGCWGTSGDERWRCERSASSPSCETVCSESYGAIAYSRQTGAWGYSFDHRSQERASRTARGQCARRAPDCQIVVNFKDQCGAIAESTRGQVRPGLGRTRKEAEDRSLAACRTAGGKVCTVVAWSCSVQ